jgi:DNA ligase 1
MITPKLDTACTYISTLFDGMHGQTASSWQHKVVESFKYNHPELVDDLDFCFEVLAGKHKLGFTLENIAVDDPDYDLYNNAKSIKDVHQTMVNQSANDKSIGNIAFCLASLPEEHADFFVKLFNREYKLGYSNRKNMVTNLHCMLAKSYPAGIPNYDREYYIQEKLNGNRCIAWYDFDQDKWRFTSRSQKEKFYPFDMSQLDPDLIYDGEVMSRFAMGNRDFSKTSGLANSKYGDKSQLVYIIYDILDSTMSYESRWQVLSKLLHTSSNFIDGRFEFFDTSVGSNVAILPPLAKIIIHPNPEYNWQLDKLLDEIVEQGGEGVMLRDPHAPYHHSSGSGDRKNYLLKYKKTKTCDLRITGWNEGKGKYEGMIGSFICEDDDHTVKVNVAGIDDDTRASNPDLWIGKIIEVAYFDNSQSQSKSTASLQFPRYKRIRTDKTETSLE